jgi:hypothetical protein
MSQKGEVDHLSQSLKKVNFCLRGERAHHPLPLPRFHISVVSSY